MESSAKSPLRVLFLTVFLDLLGFGLIIPILPLYAGDFGASDLQIGILMSIYSVMQLIFSPIMGRISDRYGRRPVLLISIAGSCISQLGYALAPSYTLLVVARGLAGVCGANVTAAQAYVADVTDDRSRAAGMGMLGAAFGLGFVFGPAFGGILSKSSPQLPFYVASALAAVNFISAWIVLKEPRSTADRTASRRITWEGLVRTVATPRLLALIVLFFVVTFGFANLEATFSLFLARRFHYGRAEASYLFVYIGIIIVIVQGGLVRRLVPRVGERRLVVIGTAMMAVGFLAQSYARTLSILLVAIFVTSVGNALNTPSLSALISRAAGTDQQGGVLGVSQSAGALARVLGPLLGTTMLRYGEGAPFLTGAVILVVACGFAVAVISQPADR